MNAEERAASTAREQRNEILRLIEGWDTERRLGLLYHISLTASECKPDDASLTSAILDVYRSQSGFNVYRAAHDVRAYESMLKAREDAQRRHAENSNKSSVF